MDSAQVSYQSPMAESVYSSFLNECGYLEADIRRHAAILEDLEQELQPLSEELEQLDPQEKELEEELQRLQREIFFSSAKETALKAELEIQNQLKENSVKLETQLEEEAFAIEEHSRAEQRTGIEEALRISRAMLMVSQDYVMNIDDQIEAAKKDIADLQTETTELCSKLEADSLAKQKAQQEAEAEENDDLMDTSDADEKEHHPETQEEQVPDAAPNVEVAIEKPVEADGGAMEEETAPV